MEGWIKLHRSILRWEWFDEDNVFRVFTYLILSANYEDKKWRGLELSQGSVVTSYKKLGEPIKLSPQQVRTALDKLKLTGEITIKTSNKGTIIQLVNYKQYQVATSELTTKQQTNNKQITNEQQTDNKQITTIKESKEVEEVKKIKKVKTNKGVFSKPSLGEVEDYLFEKFNDLEHSVLKKEAINFIDYYDSNGWKVGRNPMKKWTSAVSNWIRRNSNQKRVLTMEEKIKLMQ